jgi:catalase
VLDPTKIVPEELVPVVPVGKLVLNRNPDNFFAETEQVAFCTAHVVPGIDFSNDPLLAGRIHSYVDTQISRLGGANFHEIPINAPIAPVHNNQRDGMHRQGIHRGRVSYEPNSLGGGCPFQAGAKGFVSFPEPMETGAHKVRGKAERFADHYTQATLFWKSQTPVEQTHIINAFRFELSKVQVPAIRERMVSGLMNVAPELADAVARGLGIDRDAGADAEGAVKKVMLGRGPPSPCRHRGWRTAASRRDAGYPRRRRRRRSARRPRVPAGGRRGAVPVHGPKLGTVSATDGGGIQVDAPVNAAPAVVFDAVILPDGADAVAALAADGRMLEFLKDQYRHCKPILVLGAASGLIEKAGIPLTLPSGKPDTGLVVAASGEAAKTFDAFTRAIAAHRHFARETDPPRV